MKKVYFIGGIGADKRIFSLLDLTFCEFTFVDWIKPITHESLKDYALRMRKKIPELSPAIVGISFGGMLVTEMAKSDPNINGIILASNKTTTEFPWWFRIGKFIPLYKWTPPFFSKRLIAGNTWLLGAKDKTQKKLLRTIIKESDIHFSKWAIEAILHWENKIIPANITHIHGTADRLLPYRFVKADFTIKDGTHVITMDKHNEISLLLKKLIG
jgi:pimeloyl-ACP methyl ester carboxylesterase